MSEWYFGLHIDPLSLGGKTMVLLLAVLCGGLVGLERQWSGNAAGLRTHILVCVGSTVLTLASVEIGTGMRGGTPGDPGRIAAQVVTGIGFLGAGAILRDGFTVHGLTTAASIWVTAAIGLALGASPRLGELATVTTVIVLCTLVLLRRLEEALNLKESFYILEILVHEERDSTARILDLLTAQAITISGIQTEVTGRNGEQGVVESVRRLRLRVRLPRKFDLNALNQRLLEVEGLLSFRLD